MRENDELLFVLSYDDDEWRTEKKKFSFFSS